MSIPSGSIFEVPLHAQTAHSVAGLVLQVEAVLAALSELAHWNSSLAHDGWGGVGVLDQRDVDSLEVWGVIQTLKLDLLAPSWVVGVGAGGGGGLVSSSADVNRNVWLEGVAEVLCDFVEVSTCWSNVEVE